MSDNNKKKESGQFLSITRVVDAPYNYNAGYYVSKYLRELMQNKRIIGVKCPQCGKVYVPPRVVCGPCFVELKDFVDVSNKGTISAFSITRFPFTDPNTGEPKKVPFCGAFIKLDGTDTNIMHLLDETDEKKIKAGMRVQAVFNEERTGNHFTDIKYFRII
jgi:uncharacterized protein